MSFGRLGALGRGFGRMGGGGKSSAVVIPGVITALKGTYTITGNDANLAYGRLPLTAALGTYAVTGVDATLTYSAASGNGFVLMTDGASRVLQTDGTSKIIKAAP